MTAVTDLSEVDQAELHRELGRTEAPSGVRLVESHAPRPRELGNRVVRLGVMQEKAKVRLR